MRVCLVNSSRPFEIYYGGEEKFTISYSEWLAAHGIQVVLVTRKGIGVHVVEGNKGTLPDARPVSTGPLVKVPYLIYSVAMCLVSFLLALNIIQQNKKARISVIHAQDTGYAGLAALLAHMVLRAPVIISAHGIRYNSLKRIVGGCSRIILPFQWWLDTISTKSASLVITVSESVKVALLRIRNRKMVVIPSAVSLSEYATDQQIRREVRENLRIDEGAIVFGFVGRLSPEKNPTTLVNAFVRASNSRSDIRLLVVGTGPLENDLKSICKTNHIEDRVIFTGARRDVPSLLQAIDVYVIPSYTEGSPLSLLEAMASGKAIIASNIPSIREVLDEESGALFINPSDVVGLEHAILDLSAKPSQRERSGHIALTLAQHYDIDAIYQRIKSSYDQISDIGASSSELVAVASTLVDLSRV
ncbi:MAG: glycosyltransferase family 4 protein [Nitrososphaerota archaeon]|nr:glycosyltransferase family 4 protein [Nitrososphaerota archaeon]